MAPASGPLTVPTRPWPQAGRRTSALGLIVPGGELRGTLSARSILEHLHRAREHGVTLFDVVGSSEPARAWSTLVAAFGTDPAGLTVVVPGDEGARLPGTVRSSAGGTTGGGPAFDLLYESGARGASVEGAFPDSARLVHLAGEEERLPPASESGVYAGPFSLLDQRLGRLFGDAPPGGSAAVLARDPFAGGLLDGSRFTGDWLRRAPSGPPSSLRSLSREFEPVLGFGFLTAERRRTLAQAAIQFVLGHPWVAATVVPLPPPERFGELLAAFSAPPLSPAELATARSPARPGSAPERSVK